MAWLKRVLRLIYRFSWRSPYYRSTALPLAVSSISFRSSQPLSSAGYPNVEHVGKPDFENDIPG